MESLTTFPSNKKAHEPLNVDIENRPEPTVPDKKR
jgi:hypothetical protein